MYKLIIRLDGEFVVLISQRLAQALAARLRSVFVTKLLTNNKRLRNVLLTPSRFLSRSIILCLEVFVCVCV